MPNCPHHCPPGAQPERGWRPLNTRPPGHPPQGYCFQPTEKPTSSVRTSSEKQGARAQAIQLTSATLGTCALADPAQAGLNHHGQLYEGGVEGTARKRLGAGGNFGDLKLGGKKNCLRVGGHYGGRAVWEGGKGGEWWGTKNGGSGRGTGRGVFRGGGCSWGGDRVKPGG